MTRSKVVMAYIQNDAARKATYKKRKPGLLKKCDELTTLCGVDGCAIICSPYSDVPEAWPNPAEVRRVLARLRNLPEEDQGKKMLDQETYLRQRVEKAGQLLEKLRKESREKELNNLLSQCFIGDRALSGLETEEAKEVLAVAENALASVGDRLRYLRRANGASSSSAAP